MRHSRWLLLWAMWEPGICPDWFQFNICEHTFLLNKFSGQIVKIWIGNFLVDTIFVVMGFAFAVWTKDRLMLNVVMRRRRYETGEQQARSSNLNPIRNSTGTWFIDRVIIENARDRAPCYCRPQTNSKALLLALKCLCNWIALLSSYFFRLRNVPHFSTHGVASLWPFFPDLLMLLWY